MIALGGINIILKDPAHVNSKKTVTAAKMWVLGEMIALRSSNIILKNPAHVNSKKMVTTAIMWTLFQMNATCSNSEKPVLRNSQSKDHRTLQGIQKEVITHLVHVKIHHQLHWVITRYNLLLHNLLYTLEKFIEITSVILCSLYSTMYQISLYPSKPSVD